MLKFKPLELCDKEIISEIIKDHTVYSSELTFTTFYIWRNLLNVEYTIIDNTVVFKTQHNSNPFSLRFPLGSGDKKAVLEKLINHFGKDTRFYGLTEDMLKVFDDRFEISEMTDFADYVYESEKLITLSGKKFHSKRNHINSFNKLYNGVFSPITKDDYEFITSNYNNWQKEDDEYLAQERTSIGDLIKNFDYLGLWGEKLTVDGQLAAFTIGEKLNNDTAVIHIEKADTNFKGAYAVINQHFAENYLKDFKYINREEDMGLEGLKKAKLSYCPVKMIKKYKGILL